MDLSDKPNAATNGRTKQLVLPATFIFSFILLLSVASAAVTIGVTDESAVVDFTIAKNTPYDLKQSCLYNGTWCLPTTACNLTVVSPNGNAVISNKEMTYNPSYFNYTLPPLDFKPHKIAVTCVYGGQAGTTVYWFDVTADGQKYTPFPVVYFIIIVGLASLFLQYEARGKSKIFLIIGGVLFIVGGIMSLYTGFNYVDYSTLLGKGLGFSLIGLGGYLIVSNVEWGD